MKNQNSVKHCEMYTQKCDIQTWNCEEKVRNLNLYFTILTFFS